MKKRGKNEVSQQQWCVEKSYGDEGMTAPDKYSFTGCAEMLAFFCVFVCKTAAPATEQLNQMQVSDGERNCAFRIE